MNESSNLRRTVRVQSPMSSSLARLALAVALCGGLAGVERAALAIPPAKAPARPATPPPGPADPVGAPPAGAAARKAPLPGKRLSVDRVIAVVNDSVILQSELRRRVAPLSADLASISDRIERQRRLQKLEAEVLDDMVDEELIAQAGEEAKLEVSAKEVDSALGEIRKQNTLDDNQLAEALRLQGYTVSSYRVDVRRQILRMRAINMLVRPRVTVSDDDVRARYDAQSRRSAAVKKVKLRHILIALPATSTEAELGAAKRKAADLIEQLKGGADFARLAADHSDDESTKFTGGDLGWIERNSLDTEWEVIVFAMAQGEVRGPITGPRGLHVFQVTEVERNEQKPFAEVKEQLRGELFRREMDKQTVAWLAELRDKAHLELKL